MAEHQHHLGALAKEMNRRRQAQVRAQEGIRRAQAFEDFVALGVRRSKQALLEAYQERAAAEGPQSVPTLSREVIDRWAREDDWLNRAHERDLEAIAKARQALESVQVEAFERVGQLVSSALGVVEDIVTGKDAKATPTVRLRAAELVLALAGVDAKTMAEAAQETPPPLPLPAGEDGEPVDFAAYYRQLVQSR